MKNIILEEFSNAKETLENFIAEEKNINAIEEAASMISKAIEDGNKVISCGNGGSHCDAMHFAEEMTGKFRENRSSLPAIAISDPAHLSCTANDFGFAHVFSRFVSGIGKEGDILLAISTSGNSENIIEAIKEARLKGMKILGLTGKSGGQMAEVCDVEIRVPHVGYADRIQEIHIKIIHILILLIEKNLNR